MATKDKLLAAFEAADEINASLWQVPLDPQYMSVDEFHQHVKDNFGVAVTIRVVDVETEHVYGFIERYENGAATIYIVKNIPPRWKRLVGTKELCQIVLDKKSDYNADGEDTMQRLFTSSLGVDMAAPENAALFSEYVAEVVAWELLYPHEMRKADKAKIDAQQQTFGDIAARLKLPSEVVAVILSPPYLGMCDKYWAEVYAAKCAFSAGGAAAE